MVIEFAPETLFRPLDEQFVSDVELWTDPKGRRLSDRVWLAGQETRRQIDRELRLALVSGEDPLVLARRLEQFLDPRLAPVRDEKTGRLLRWKRDTLGRVVRDARGRKVSAQPKGAITRTPRGGGGSYPARRLARTEITRAFGIATKEAAALNPFVQGVKWNLSGTYDPARDFGVCADNANGNSEGLPRGVYRVDEVPAYPAHPQERCTLSPFAEPDTDAVVEQLRQDVGSESVGTGVDPAATPSPVSRAFTLPPEPSGLMRQTIEIRGDVDVHRVAQDALGAIDFVHSDGPLPTIPVRSDFKQFSNTAAVFEYHADGSPAAIGINSLAKWNASARNSFVHEAGHFLDLSGVGTPGQFASHADPLLDEWRDAVNQTAAIRHLRSIRDAPMRTVRLSDGKTADYPVNKKYVDYLLEPDEMWARSYDQYIAMKSRDPDLVRGIQDSRQSNLYPSQWDDDDFAPIATAIDTLFTKLGWRS